MPACPPVPVTVSHIGNLHHIGGREEQQDSFAISDVTNSTLCEKRGSFAVVADGMGGLSNGARISAIVTSSMMSRFEEGNREEFRGEREIPMELLQMVQNAEREALRFLGTSHEQSGSTVVAAWIYAGRLYFISVGDSRICLLRNGTVTILNREHTYGSELDEMAARGEIPIKEARENVQRHALTSYIGIEPLEKIDRNIHGLPLLPGDKILLMSDGVFGTISEKEILKAAVQDAAVMAQDLQAMVLSHRRSGQDNFTAVILQCE
nr:protein phosphatase 2C domain-containing protein [Lientehia hominis]